MVLAWGPEQVSGLARERVAASAQVQEPDRAWEAVPGPAQAVVPVRVSVRGPDLNQARAPARGLETVKGWEPARERAVVLAQAREPDPARRAVPEPVQAEALAWALVQGPGSGQAQA